MSYNNGKKMKFVLLGLVYTTLLCGIAIQPCMATFVSRPQRHQALVFHRRSNKSSTTTNKTAKWGESVATDSKYLFVPCSMYNENNNEMDRISATTCTNQYPYVSSLAMLLLMTAMPEMASAVDSFGISPTWNSAFLAYGHYFFILLGTILLTYERVTVAADMSVDKEKSLVLADALYGIVGALLGATGYFRVVSEYGKGWEYYAHEPVFWLKLSAAGLLAGLSLFPTITFIKRGTKLFQNEDIEPMSEELALRVRKVLNAEISAILSIPLMATLMARGVGYNADFPWQLGAAFAVITLVGSGAAYARQALTWTEPSP